jgi:hypothetical protein
MACAAGAIITLHYGSADAAIALRALLALTTLQVLQTPIALLVIIATRVLLALFGEVVV